MFGHALTTGVAQSSHSLPGNPGWRIGHLAVAFRCKAQQPGIDTATGKRCRRANPWPDRTPAAL